MPSYSANTEPLPAAGIASGEACHGTFARYVVGDVCADTPPVAGDNNYSIGYVQPCSGVLTSDNASNLYNNRDFRRKYPRTEPITQQFLTQLLLAQPNEDGTKRCVFCLSTNA